MALPSWLAEDERTRYVYHRDAQAGRTRDFPDWVSDAVRTALGGVGVTRLWEHQAEAAQAAFDGRHVAISTGTASGKTLAYLLPVIAATFDGQVGFAAARPFGLGSARPSGLDSARPSGLGSARPSGLDSARPSVITCPSGTMTTCPSDSGATVVRTDTRSPITGTPTTQFSGLDLTARGHSAIYLAPTKALAHDQYRVCRSLGLAGWPVCAYDGDSSDAERRFARDSARYVLTNPDMLHRGVLPNHQRWTRLLATLRYVVIDEAHRYRGVFGAHVAGVLRRLRRLAASYGAEPVFLAASATVTDAASLLARLTGVDGVLDVSANTSARPELDIALWQPDGDPHQDAAALMSRLVAGGLQTLCFTSSRLQAELVALRAQRSLGSFAGEAPFPSSPAPVPSDPPIPPPPTAPAPTPPSAPAIPAIASYRSGYLPWDRRDIERRLQDGTLRGVASTNALELGVDISGVDAVITCGFPGTRAALWQQFGRAGRAGREAVAVLVARDDPLDAFWCDHPEALFLDPVEATEPRGVASSLASSEATEFPVEATVLHPDNPRILGPHLAAAAQEFPLTPADERFFGPTTTAVADQLAASGLLRRRPAGWFWTRPDRAVDSIDLRTSAAGVIDVIDARDGRVIGVADPATADRTVHPGAIYLHQGVQWIVTSYDPDGRTALVAPSDAAYTTQALVTSTIAIAATTRTERHGRAEVSTGEVDLSSQVVGYLRRDRVTGKVWDAIGPSIGSGERTSSLSSRLNRDTTDLDLPIRTLHTQAVWWTLADDDLANAGIATRSLAGAAHAAEHTAIGLLPAFAPCDRWDIGGLSTLAHPDTGRLTIFVHDGHPGGAGFAERGFDVFPDWMDATALRLRTCACESGCPRCVVSPKCGNGNQPLDKAAAALLVALIVS